ncbi:hypothetical protein BP5796_12109 [Coleophoma crateriformis]|uniref:beta-aspartyl-peptidase n=1 Tax=Coleophoma crateriformis TaxID=565419 RepID=A0A3D8QBF3_9HELO|nr:hypothetical protein BP5796_12109 [Coleophoma crateriformis]
MAGNTNDGLSPKPLYSVALHAGAAESWFGASDTRMKTEAFIKDVIMLAETQLISGIKAVDVVTNIVEQLENHPQFNAGKGAAINIEGFHELEAAVIDGSTSEYRAAAGLRQTKNPVRLARAMMSKASPVFIAGPTADALACRKGLEMVENEYFSTQSRKNYWLSNIDRVRSIIDHHGTVGAVALDIHGHLAAANSTGGLMFKSIGRIGDTAIIGAGIYADDEVAIACSGSGETILKASIAGRAAADVRHGRGIDEAIKGALLRSTDLDQKSSSGAIGIDAKGTISIHCNSRIFAVASASSTSQFVAGFIPSTIPIINQLICFENELIRVGMSRHPTAPNQLSVELKRNTSIMDLELKDFLDYFCTLRIMSHALQKISGLELCGFVMAGDQEATLLPISAPLAGSEGTPESPTALSLETRELPGDYRATFHFKPDYMNPAKVEIGPANHMLTGLLSTEDYTIGLAIAIWTTLELLHTEFGQTKALSVLEIYQAFTSGAIATLSESGSAESHFPAPAPFHKDFPGFMTVELGRRAENLLELPAIAQEVSRIIKEL